MHLPLYNLQAFLIAAWSGATEKVWQHDLYSCPFQVTDCTDSTPSTSSHWTETPPIFFSLHWIFPVSKQTSWSGKDPKHNTRVQVMLIWRGIPASFGHTAPAGAQGTLPGHWRLWAMHSWAACAGPQQKASACQKAIWFVFVSKWLIICGKFCFFSLFTLLKHVITRRHLTGISYLFTIMSDTSLKFKSNAGVQHLIRFYPITITSSPQRWSETSWLQLGIGKETQQAYLSAPIISLILVREWLVNCCLWPEWKLHCRPIKSS